MYRSVSGCANPARLPAITTIVSVIRGGTRSIAALIVAVLATVLIAACGGSDSETTASSTATSTTGGGKQEGSRGTTGGGSQKDGSGGSSQGSAGSSAEVSTPLKVSGGGSEQFRSKGGDNSIQDYGEEGDESELQAAAEAVHGFYVARAEGDWGSACSYLAKSMVGQLEALAGQSPQLKNAGCAPVLNAFTRSLPASVRRETTVVDAASLRDDGDRGFLIYFDSEHKPYAMPLANEDGAWKLTLLSAAPLG